MLVALGTTAADLGVITLVTLVVFAAKPLPPLEALQSGLVSLAGGLFQTLLSVALWPIRPYAPERRIIASLYSALASMARTPAPPSISPPISTQFSDAQEALTSLSGDRSLEAERHVYLLNQAERIRLSILTLGRLTRRIARDERGREAARTLTQVLQAAAIVLSPISRAGKKLAQFDESADAFRHHDWNVHTAFFAALIRDATRQVDALGGQLRAAADVASNIAAARLSGDELSNNKKNQPWFLQISGTIPKLQANLSLHSTVFRHAVRLAVCLGVGDALGRTLSLQRTYWIPMTIAIVLKPDFTATFSRGVLRVGGTFAGLILATALFHFLNAGIATEIALMTGFIFLLRWIGPANYGILVTALSAMVVLLIATTGVAPKDVISARALNTAVGGLLAMVAYAVWPTWEKTQVAPALADMLDAYRIYFRAVLIALTAGSSPNIDALRLNARRARSNAEASVERMSGEPGVTPEQLNLLNAILVNSHGFVHAAMSLESGLYQTGTVPARAATVRFAEQAQDTLAALATALRSGKMRQDLPDLRQAYNGILQSPETVVERYALVNVEADRITTSLNTLAEQIARWTGDPRGRVVDTP
jgi:uncharacterized membrane protein YccC